MDTKALRQKVLDLAIRGKLVPQDPNDEPASVLLERIRAEKQRLVKEGKLKAKDIKGDTIIFVGDDNLHYEKFADGSVKCIEDEIPFELADGWAWGRLTTLLDIFITGPFGSSLHKSDYVENGIPLINPMNIVDGEIMPIDKMQVSNETVERLASFKVIPNDIVIARRGDMGRCAVVHYTQTGWLCGTGSFVLRLSTFLWPEYFAACIRSPYAVTYLSGNSIGNTMLNLNQAILKNLLLPVPPFKEQKRIIDGINNADAYLKQLSDEREHLIATVAKTKAKILDLAIRGQLVPQNSSDEPASVLLDRIRIEKEELIRQGKLKRDKKESVIFKGDDNSYYEKIEDTIENIENEIPFEIPDNWHWCKIRDMCTMAAGKSKPTEAIHDTPFIGSYPCFGGNGIRGYVDEYSHAGKYSIIGRQGALCGNVNVAEGRFYATEHAVVTALFSGIDFTWSNYLLTALHLNQYATGAAQPGLSVANILNLFIPLPPYNEQIVIGKRINQLFDLLDSIGKSLS